MFVRGPGGITHSHSLNSVTTNRKALEGGDIPHILGNTCDPVTGLTDTNGGIVATINSSPVDLSRGYVTGNNNVTADAANVITVGLEHDIVLIVLPAYKGAHT